MDSVTEKQFLEVFDGEKEAIFCRSNTKQGKELRAQAWHNVKLELEARTGKIYEIKQLQKKWNNIQTRIKERHKSRPQTCGNSYEFPNDAMALRILGKNNDSLFCASEVSRNEKKILQKTECEDSDNESLSLNISTPIDSVNVPTVSYLLFDSRDINQTKKSNSKVNDTYVERNTKNKQNNMKGTNEIDMKAEVLALQKETLLLKRKKLKLEITLLEKRMTEKIDKCTQTTIEDGALLYE